MRIRSVHPAFWRSLTLAKLTREQRLFFVGLWSAADDDGRGVAEARILKGELFSLDDDITPTLIREWLAILASVGLIVLYETPNSKPLYQVVNWSEHQRPNKPTRSKLPPPPLSRAPSDPPTETPVPLPESSGSPPGGNRNRSRNGGKEQEGSLSASPKGEPNWVREAVAIFEPIGLIPFGRIGRALKPLVKLYGWDTGDPKGQHVKRWLTVYVDARPYMRRDGSIWGDKPGDSPENEPPRDTRHVTPEDFARTLTTWQTRCGWKKAA